METLPTFPRRIMRHIGHASAVVRLWVVGSQFYRSREVGDCTLAVSFQVVGKAAVVVGFGIVGLQLDRRGVVGDRPIVFTSAAEGLAAFQVELGVTCRLW